jgi:hypothetical protein
MDPRIYQISALAGLLIYGLGWLNFDIGAPQVMVTVGGVLLAQWICSRIWKVERFDPRSALISGLSLCLLFRTNHVALALAGAVIAIASKFALRFRGKHIFNPTNFGLVAMMLATNGAVWVSPGQWGNMAFFGFLLACIGGLVVMRAARSDVTLAFLGAYLALAKRRAAALRVLYDQRPAHDAGFADRPDPFRRARGVWRVGRAVSPLPHEWTALVARAVRARRATDRLAAAGRSLSMGFSRPCRAG